MSFPRKRMAPLGGWCIPRTDSTKVVFPAPLAPRRVTTSPFSTCMERPQRIWAWPRKMLIPFTSSIRFSQICLDDPRVGDHLFGFSFADHLTLIQDDDPVRTFHDGPHHVFDPEDGDFPFAADP